MDMSRYFKHTLLVAIFLICAPYYSHGQVTPRSARIGNPNPVGSGARALGMGNAFIAVSDDATAASWNPGGLTQLQKPEISFALESVSRKTSSTTEFTNGMNENFRASQSINLEDFNYASVVYPFTYDDRINMVFSLNYLKLYRFDDELTMPATFNDPPLSATGFDTSDTEGTFSVIAPAIGVDVTENFSLGLTFNIWDHSITGDSFFETKDQSFKISSFAPFPDTVTNTVGKSRYEVDEGYSFVIGGLYRITSAWTVGVVAKPEYTLELDHSRVGTSTNNGVPTEFASRTNTDLDFPWIVGLGVAYHPSDPVTVSFDVTWTDWSDFILEENGLEFNPKLTTQGVSEDLDDTYTVRLGTEYVIELEEYLIPVRCGIGYDPSPDPGEVDDFLTFNFGVGAQLADRLNFDIAYEYRWGEKVNQSALQAFNAVDGGSQDSRQHRVMLSTVVYF